MKKLMVLLMVLAIAMGSVFAAEGYWSGTAVSDTSSDPAELKVTLDLEGFQGLYTIGFTDTAVETEPEGDPQEVTITPISDYTLTLKNDEYIGDAYVYYAVKTDQKLSFNMAVSGALDEQNSEKAIDWEVKAGNATLNSGNYGAEQEVGTFEGDGSYAIGSWPMSMTTVGFLADSTAAGEVYTATVKLTVKTTT